MAEPDRLDTEQRCEVGATGAVEDAERERARGIYTLLRQGS